MARPTLAPGRRALHMLANAGGAALTLIKAPGRRIEQASIAARRNQLGKSGPATASIG